jgi:hypothetical protein
MTDKLAGNTLYYCSCNNFGDALNKYLFEKVFDVEFNYCENIWYADYIAIGSVLNWACSLTSPIGLRSFLSASYSFLRSKKKFKSLTVLGAGFQNWTETSEIKFLRKMKYKIVRGKLTEDYLRKHGHLTGEVLLGDLGLLCPYMADERIDKKYALGIIPHFWDLNSPVIYDIYKKYGSRCVLINVQDNVYKVLKQIQECETIISSSLHGLIVSDSFNVPNLWVENSLRYPKTDYFKYRDYYSIYTSKERYPVTFLEFIDKNLNFIADNYIIGREDVAKKQKELFGYCKNHFDELKPARIRAGG